MPNVEEPEYMNFYEELPADDDSGDAGDADNDSGDADDDGDAGDGDSQDGSDADDDGSDGTDDDSGDDGEDDKSKKKDPRKQQVPFSKLQKERNRRIAAEEELEKLRGKKDGKSDDAKSGDDAKDDKEPELDERSQKAVDKYMRSKGYVTREELKQEENLTKARAQLETDKTELTKWAQDNGYPEFDAVKVDEWADKNLGKGFVKNKATLKAAYMAMHDEKIREAERKAALSDADEGNAQAKRPGARSDGTEIEEEPKTGRGRLRGMIRKARQEIDAGK